MVTADRGLIVTRADTVTLDSNSTLTELLLHNPGLLINDNGGWAGLKSVNFRGLGSAHTAIYIDGVRVGNLQSGQNDLGMLPLDQMSAAVVDYAQNSLSFITRRPDFGNLPVSGTFRMHAGSFGTWLPSARLDFRLSDEVSMSAHAAGIISEGNYEYADGALRENNDIMQMRAGLDFWGVLSTGDWHAKAYFNGSERGTPGSVSWPSVDRQQDRNAFVQAFVRKAFADLYTLRVSAKGSYDSIFYTSSWGDSRYGQTEFQINSSHDFRLNDLLKLTFAADFQWDGLDAGTWNASRTSVLTACGLSLKADRVEASAAVEYMFVGDCGAQSRHVISPSFDVRVAAFDGFDVVAFARRAPRVPTFNELYYVGYGNPDLRPEDAWLTDIGVDYNRKIGQSWKLKLKADGYMNILTDKIMSAPSEADPNIWYPHNIGRVRSAGADASAGMTYATGHWLCSIDAEYSFQDAVDITPDAYTYGQQLPFVARHSLVVKGAASWKGWRISPVWQLRSCRSDSAGPLPDWNTLDISFDKSFVLGKAGALSARIALRNVLDERYELVSGYPMPGRSLTAGLEYKF